MNRRLRTILHLLEQRKLTELQLEFDALLLEDQSEEVNYLYHLFNQKLYAELSNAIQNVLQKTHQIAPSNVIIQGLKTQISILETRLSVAQYKKTEILKEIDKFRIRHNSDLGLLIGKILKLQMEIFYLLQNDDEVHRVNYQEAKKDYTAYRHQRRSLKKFQPLQMLDENQRERMKKMYREATKLCHPDIVIEDLRAEAQ
jgi:ribosomal protein S24E